MNTKDVHNTIKWSTNTTSPGVKNIVILIVIFNISIKSKQNGHTYVHNKFSHLSGVPEQLSLSSSFPFKFEFQTSVCKILVSTRFCRECAC